MSGSDPSAREPDEEAELAGTRMPFGAHLDELRRRLIRALLVILAGLVAAFAFHQDILAIVVRPYRQAMAAINQDPTLKVVGVAQGVFVSMKVAFFAGLIATAPFWIHQIWAFIAAGLYRRERRLIYRFAPLCAGLFFLGVAFGYFVLLPIGLGFLITFTDPELVQNWIGLNEYLGFFALLTILLGVAFQVPVVMLGLARSGLVRVATFRERRRWVILGIFVVAAVVTPPDPITQTLLAVPLCGLYELGIVLAWAGLGQKRPRLDRRVLRQRLIVLGAVGLLLAVAWGPVRDWRRRAAVAEALKLDRDGGPDLRALFAQPGILGSPPETVLRLTPPGPTELWIADDGHRCVVVQLEQVRERTTVTGRSERGIEAIHSPSGVLRTSLHRPAEVPWAQVLPPLLASLEAAGQAEFDRLRDPLARLTGLELPAGRAELLAALRAIARERSSEVLRQ